jgi:hypothetical protein
MFTLHCVVYIPQSSQPKVRRDAPVGDFPNLAFDDGELKELPPIPREEIKDKTLDIKVMFNQSRILNC